MPDIVLLDIMLPDIDGYEICRKIRLDPNTRGIPVIFVSGKSKQEDVNRGLSIGGQDYITKPFQNDELLASINRFIGRGENDPDERWLEAIG